MDFPQPTLPAEGVYTDMERLFIDEQPKELWPKNQNSNFGLLRRVLTDVIQNVVDNIGDLYAEFFIATSVGFLGLWEDEMGLPRGDGFPTDLRRSYIANRRIIGPFTRTRRKNVVESFIMATLGTPIEILPDGIPLVPGGVPFHGEWTSSDLTALYTITESIGTFHYTVTMAASLGVDEPGLTRELDWITPSGMSFDLVFT